ncbi:hypothetical protein CPB83DRAFT_857475 [Crepidotus variabilis]|uniref:Uncharacterized protein n=1 Tax=Crepidotus variabilis TaxID=179855 RepID=A0A9P6JMY3_9AGAR|nr:hypothetical protein CPB83DRAFT_857475 [Crepidotus variabilis]
MASVEVGHHDGLPNELFDIILQQLNGDYPTLSQVALTCKLLLSEAQALLYQSLCYTVKVGSLFYSPPDVGPPPRAYILNPSLAKHLKRIVYTESPEGKQHEDMHTILSAAFSNLYPQLKSLEVTFWEGLPPGFLKHGRFKLEVLHMSGSNAPENILRILKRQPELKCLRIASRRRIGIDKIPLPSVANLEVLEGTSSVVLSVLPSRNVKTLVWEPSPLERVQLENFESISAELNALTALSYALSEDLPPFDNIANHLRNLKHLTVEHKWNARATGYARARQSSLIKVMPEYLASLSALRGLTLSISDFHYPQDLDSNHIDKFFLQCPSLRFVDIEQQSGLDSNRVKRQFERWVKRQDGQATKLDKVLQYNKFPRTYYIDSSLFESL